MLGRQVSYCLGIDVGTTFTAAALLRDGVVEIFALATYQVAVPSVIWSDGDEVLYGEPAERRGAVQPSGLAREFKRRLGDPVPLMLSGSPFHADRLTALMAKWVVESVSTQTAGTPEAIVLTHPANWTEYQLGVMRNALGDVGLSGVQLLSEPAAAALDYAATATVEAGATVLVYDLGGGTFDVALLRREGAGFEHQIEPGGIERLGGIDFDEAMFQHVLGVIPREVLAAARQQPEGAAALAQLKRRCVDAKEALSSDIASDVPVMLPSFTSTVRITRPEFEDMIRPMIRQTIEVVERTLARARMTPEELNAVLLVGGSSRVPLVPQMVGEQLGLPVRIDAHPKLVVAKGAARHAGALAPSPRTPHRRSRARHVRPPASGGGDAGRRGCSSAPAPCRGCSFGTRGRRRARRARPTRWPRTRRRCPGTTPARAPFRPPARCCRPSPRKPAQSRHRRRSRSPRRRPPPSRPA